MSDKLIIFRGNEAHEIELTKGSVSINLNIDSAISLVDRKERNYWSLDFSIEGTPQNHLAFDNAYDTNVVQDVSIRGVKISAHLTLKGITWKGQFLLLGVDVVNDKITYSGQFLGGLINVFENLPTNLCDFDFGTFTWDKTTIDASLANGDPYDSIVPYQFAPIYFGEPFPSTHYPINVIRPSIFVPALFDEVANITGIPIESSFLGTEYARRQVIPATDFKEQTEEVFDMTLFAALDTSTLLLGNLHPLGGGVWTVTDPFAMSTPFVFTMPVFLSTSVELVVKCSFDFTPAPAITGVISLINDLATIVYEDLFINTGQNDIELNATLSGGDVFRLQITNGTLAAGASFTFCFTSTDPIESFDVNISDFLPCLDTKKFLTGYFNLHNLITFYNEKTGRLLIEPRYDVTLPTGETVSGFYRGIEKIEDWTEIKICEESDSYTPIEDISQSYRLAFKEDNKDAYVTDEWQFATINELNTRYEKGETDVRNDVFAPTLTGLLPFGVTSADLAPTVPYMIKFSEDDSNKEISYEFDLRLLYFVGLRSGEWDWYSDANLFTDYPNLVQVDEVENINLGFAPITGNDGLMIFHEKDIDILNDSVFKSTSVELNPLHVIDLESFFRDLKHLSSKTGSANYIIKNARINFEGTTDIELVKF